MSCVHGEAIIRFGELLNFVGERFSYFFSKARKDRCVHVEIIHELHSTIVNSASVMDVNTNLRKKTFIYTFELFELVFNSLSSSRGE